MRVGSSGDCLRTVILLALLAVSCGRRPAGPVAGDGSAPDRSTPDLPSAGDTRSAPDLGSTSPYVGEVLRACTLAVSCNKVGFPSVTPSPWFSSVSDCVDAFSRLDWPSTELGWFAAPSRILAARLLSCAAKTVRPAVCGSFHACLGGSWPSLSMCGIGAHCNGTKLTRADSGYSLDCSVLGRKCQDLPTSVEQACCMGAPCNGGTVCDEAEGRQCMFGAAFEFDCGPSGRRCSTTLGVFCVGEGASCHAEDEPTCKGSEARYCAGGQLSHFDCSQTELRQACDPSHSSLPCRPSGAECQPSFEGACSSGDQRQLIACANGRRVMVSCSDLGFELCLPASDVDPARCGFYL